MSVFNECLVNKTLIKQTLVKQTLVKQHIVLLLTNGRTDIVLYLNQS